MRQDPLAAAAEQIVFLESLCKQPEDYLSYDVICDPGLSCKLKPAAFAALKRMSGENDVPVLMSGAGYDATAMSHLTKVGMLLDNPIHTY
ncbi:allantoate deiminase 2-like [Primulina huaijiensis]|uniref:allantoate deiminase 2-like n=1 Tax=Primulina huaijiensis TaxID=1492673 RepID=UPI003CC77A56